MCQLSFQTKTYRKGFIKPIQRVSEPTENVQIPVSLAGQRLDHLKISNVTSIIMGKTTLSPKLNA